MSFYPAVQREVSARAEIIRDVADSYNTAKEQSTEFFHNECWQKSLTSLLYIAAKKSIILTYFKLTIILS